MCDGICIHALFRTSRSFTVLLEAQLPLQDMLGSIPLKVKGVFTEPLTLLYEISFHTRQHWLQKFTPQPSTDVGQDMGGIKQLCGNALQSDKRFDKRLENIFPAIGLIRHSQLELQSCRNANRFVLCNGSNYCFASSYSWIKVERKGLIFLHTMIVPSLFPCSQVFTCTGQSTHECTAE